MGHDSYMTRPMLVVVLILLSGIVPERLAGLKASSLRDSLKSNLFNRADLERMEHGYYEALVEGGRRLDDLAELPTLRVRWRSGSTWSIPVDQSPLVTRVDDLREVVLKKNDATTRFGLDWRTNSQGMRDREYSVEKPPGTFRVALVGDSIGAGWGVNAEDRFESILEELWNERAGAIVRRKVEIINCAVPGHSPGQRWYHFGLLGWPMEPDLVIYEATAADIGWDERRLRFLLAHGIGWDCPIYRAALTDAGVQPLGSPDYYKRALQPRHWEILSGVYRFMAADCRAHGVPVFWVLVPRIGRRGDAEGKPALIETARKAGFTGLIDLTDSFDGLDPARLTVDRDDFHPNALGHARIAQRLDQGLKAMPQVARIWETAPGSESVSRLARSKERHTERLDGQVKGTSFTPEDGGRPR